MLKFKYISHSFIGLRTQTDGHSPHVCEVLDSDES
jgi:hypothetical protein